MVSRQQLEQAYSDWVKALNDRDLEAIASLVADTVVEEDENLSREKYVQKVATTLEKSSVEKIEVDWLTIDTGARAIGARLVHRGTLKEPYLGVAPTGKPVQWLEYPLTWFNSDGKIAEVKNLIDMDALRAGKDEVPRTPELNYAPPPVGFDIPTMYKTYIDSINAQAARQNLPGLVRPVVTHNLDVSSIDDFCGFIDESFVKVEGFKLNLTHLIADEVTQRIASRIVLTGKPVGQWMGVDPTGRHMKFPEHALYKLDGGKLAYIWAMRPKDEFLKSVMGEE